MVEIKGTMTDCYTAADGRRVEVYGRPSTDMMAKFIKRLMDDALRKATTEQVEEEIRKERAI